MKQKHLNLSLWKWEGVVLVGGKPSDFKAYCEREIHASPEVAEHSAGHAYVEYGKPWVVWVESLDNVPTLAHEVFHVTTGVLEARGLSLSSASEEAYTYTLEAILRATLEKGGWRAVRP